jgi:hypothetical protein
VHRESWPFWASNPRRFEQLPDADRLLNSVGIIK